MHAALSPACKVRKRTKIGSRYNQAPHLLLAEHQSGRLWLSSENARNSVTKWYILIISCMFIFLLSPATAFQNGGEDLPSIISASQCVLLKMLLYLVVCFNQFCI